MRLAVENPENGRTQRTWARLAGLLLLGVIILAFGSGFMLSRVATGGTFAETAKRIAASEHLYRAGLATVVIATLSSALVAFALYATLKPVNNFLAQLAMIFNLGDAFLALVVRMCSFVTVRLYISAQAVGAEPVTSQPLAELMHSIADTTETLGGICFGIGTFLFFLLFFQSRYIPRILSALGVFASGIWIILYFARLIFPEQHSLFQLVCFPPMALAEITTGLYLTLFAIKAERAN